MIAPGSIVLVALSGGADSSVMLDVLLKLRKELKIEVSAAHLNHCIRGFEADLDEIFVREKCKELGIELISEKINIVSAAEALGESVELIARNIRYEFLEGARKKLSASYIATAHNANDNLETLLFNLARGSGIDGLCGIPYTRGNIIRPLLDCSRDEIENYATKHNIDFCVDKTNFETEYSRNKLRHGAVPTLIEINPAAVLNARRLSSILKTDSEFIKRCAESAADRIATGPLSLNRNLLLEEPALISRICEIFAQRATKDDEYSISFKHIEQIISLANNPSPSKSIMLPGGLLVRCEYENMVFATEASSEVFPPVPVSCGRLFWGDYEIIVEKTAKPEKIHSLLNTFFVPCDRINGSLTVRSRRTGDEIKLQNRKTKTLKKLLVDEKVPQTERDFLPVIADDEKVFGIGGFGSDCRWNGEAGNEGYIIKINKQ